MFSLKSVENECDQFELSLSQSRQFFLEYRNILLLKMYLHYYIQLLTLCEMSLTGADLKERAKMHSSEVSSFVSKARATINEMGM